jgi:hypothetical protein
LNAALGRAVERRNLQNFTPAGETRSKTLTTLRLIAEAIDDNNFALADAITNSVEPEPAGDAPSIAHLIGVSMGTLDAWYTGPALPNNLPTVQVPAWQKHARAAPQMCSPSPAKVAPSTPSGPSTDTTQG